MKQLIGIFLFILPVLAAPAEVSEDVRRIAILENERLLEAESGVRLLDYFRSKDAGVRARAVLAAGRIGNKAAISAIAPLVEDPETEVRKMAAFALGQIRAKEGLPFVSALLKDQDREVQRLALEAIGRIGGIETSGRVVPFLESSAPALREQAALALALIKDKATVDILVRKAATGDPAQWSYVYALYRLADERAVSALHEVLSHPAESPSTGDPSAVLFALKALWSMKKPLTVEESKTLLAHADPRVQQNALDVMAAGGDAAVCDAIRLRMPDLVLASKWKALETMGALKCATIAEKLKYLGTPEPVLRAAALKLIEEKELEKQLPVLERASRDESWWVRQHAAQSSAGLSLDSALQVTKRLLKDPDSAVRLAALESLGSFLPKTEDLMRPFLRSADSAERAVAVDAFGKTKNRQYLSEFVQIYEAYSDSDTRTAVIDVLADYGDSQALGILEDALTDSRFILRKHAVDALKKLTGGTSYVLKGNAVNLEDFLDRGGRVSAADQSKYSADFGLLQPQATAVIRLQKGAVVIRLLSREAPVHVGNFVKLARQGFYNGLRIHRVVPNFVIQGGDPRGDGWGGGGELVPDQFNTRPYIRGAVGMPTAGKDSGGCQFFITMSRQPHLDGNYTVFGEVLSGMEHVDNTMPGDAILSVEVE